MADPSSRRWSYSLRTLFVLVTAAALGCWAYWIALPRWQDYREQVAFEAAVKQLQAGVSERYIGPLSRRPIQYGIYGISNDVYQHVRVELFAWPDVNYYIVCSSLRKSFVASDSGKLSSIEVFRIPPPPAVYEAKTESGRKAMLERRPNDTLEKIAEEGYREDWMQFITGDRQDDYGLKYEIIYSDVSRPTGP